MFRYLRLLDPPAHPLPRAPDCAILILDSRWPTLVKTQPAHRFNLGPRGRSLPVLQGHDCVVALRALGEDTRVRIVSLLIDQPLEVGEIGKRLGVSQYNVSKHLRILREAGLLEVERTASVISMRCPRRSAARCGGKYPRSRLLQLPVRWSSGGEGTSQRVPAQAILTRVALSSSDPRSTLQRSLRRLSETETIGSLRRSTAPASRER